MKKVIIIGGGFAGSTIARALESRFDVTLIDSKDYFEFSPGVLRTIVEPQHIKKIEMLHTHYLKKAKVIVGHVTDVNKKYVFINKKKIPYDYLAVCSGSYYHSPFKERDIVTKLRAAHLRNHYSALRDAKNVMIIGGGLIGTELAAEIVGKYPDKEVTIIHAGDSLIERNPKKARDYALHHLESRGVKVVFNEKINNVKKKTFYSDTNTYKPDLAFLCTGIRSECNFMRKNFPSVVNEKGSLKVNKYLQLTGNDNIFSAGDATDISIEKTAQNAKKQGKIIAKNIIALEEGRDLREYKAKQTPLVISLGKYDGLLVNKDYVLGGIIPGIIKTLIERKEMLNLKGIFSF